MTRLKSSSHILITAIRKNSLLQISIGFVYFWFGFLKFFHGVSPAEDLATNTIQILTFSIFPSEVSILLLAVMEVFIGLFLLLNLYRKKIILLALAHMLCTFAPLLLFKDASFSNSPFIPTLLGQYIAKNIIIVSALITLYHEKTIKSRF